MNQFCNAVNTILRPKYLKWPSVSERQIIKAQFEAVQGFKNCVGAIDCTHVDLKLPASIHAGDYIDKKGHFSTVMQAIVDAKMRFLNVSVGYPGSIHDTRILANSSFWRKRLTLLDGETIRLPNSDVDIPEYIVGDDGYVLCQHIMIPIAKKELDPEKEAFNKKHSQTRIIVERAFGRWKQSWAIFDSKIKRPQLRSLYNAMVATCVLHNLLLEMGEIDMSDADFIPSAPVQPDDDELGRNQSLGRGEAQRDAMFAYIKSTL